MERIWQINGFDWGESDDLIKWPANSFFAWENIDVRTNLSATKLSPKLEDSWWVFDDNISFMTNLETLWVSWWGIVVCLENGKIYLDGTLKTTLATWTAAHDKVKWIGVNIDTGWTQYVYYISKTSSWSWEIHRSTTDLATFNVWYKSYTVTSWAVSFVWTINDSWLLYIAVKNKILLMDDTEVVQDFLILPAQEEVKWFTQFQGNFKVYTNAQQTGVQYVWDWSTEAPSYRQEWINQPILWVVNDWAFDYAVLWFNENYSDLYLISGTQRQELRVNLETAAYSRILNWFLSIREGIVYISWGKTWQSTNEGIYTYGNYYPW